MFNGGVFYDKNFNVESKLGFYVDKIELGYQFRKPRRLLRSTNFNLSILVKSARLPPDVKGDFVNLGVNFNIYLAQCANAPAHSVKCKRCKSHSPTKLRPTLQVKTTGSYVQLLYHTLCDKNISINKYIAAKAAHKKIVKLTPYVQQ